MTKESLFSNIWRACSLMRSDDGTPKQRQNREREQGSKMTTRDELLHLIAQGEGQ